MPDAPSADAGPDAAPMLPRTLPSAIPAVPVTEAGRANEAAGIGLAWRPGPQSSMSRRQRKAGDRWEDATLLPAAGVVQQARIVQLPRLECKGKLGLRISDSCPIGEKRNGDKIGCVELSKA